MSSRRYVFPSSVLVRLTGRLAEALRGRPAAGAPARPAALPRLGRRARWLALAGIAAVIFWIEAHTGVLEAPVLAALSSRLRAGVGTGASPSIVFPRGGPLDRRRGYAELPGFSSRLEDRGFRITEQARFSAPLAFAARIGITPPFGDQPGRGLEIRGWAGGTLYRAAPDRPPFASYSDVPPLVRRTLMYLENRKLMADRPTMVNPAIEWTRTFHAFLLWGVHRLGLPVHVDGGSTLPVQLEKFRHSPEGRTRGMLDKLRQVVSASLEAYRAGLDTRPARERALVDYLNSVPLAATPGHGEVFGLGDGLREWFGLDPREVLDTLAQPAGPPATARSDVSLETRARAYKPVLALLCAVRSPSRYLRHDRVALEQRVDGFTDLLARAGVLDGALADAVHDAPLEFAEATDPSRDAFAPERKTAEPVRLRVAELLGVPSFYDLDRLDLSVRSTLSPALERRASALFADLADPAFVARNGLVSQHVLERGDPAGITYSFLLMESTPEGDCVRAQVDNLRQPFDVNDDMKLELGSTAKLRTLAHYLELVGRLHSDLWGLDADSLATLAAGASDPLTAWATDALVRDPTMPLDTLLARSLERTYSASPRETFFTGGGLAQFHNFDPDDDGRTLTVREAAAHSTNLVFVRLMRDLVAYHVARLPYDAAAVLAGTDTTDRHRLLERALEGETGVLLRHAWERYRQEGAAADAAGHRLPPLDAWCAAQLAREPGLGWDELWARSDSVRAATEEWLFSPRQRRAQDDRLRTEIERDAFAAMTADWRRLGFPFDHLVPSLATAIGGSGDRPAALADLLGAVVNDGVARPEVRVSGLAFGPGTPYYTAFAASAPPGRRVLSSAVARALRGVLAGVVDHGTARSVRGVFLAPGGTPLAIGGKTGSGDNRIDRFARGGRLISSRPASRTAAFAFYLGDRYFGVITASVLGARAGEYGFTSALPLAVLRLLAPAIADEVGARVPSAKPAGLQPTVAAGSGQPPPAHRGQG